MKKIYTILALLALCTSAFSQNVALPFSVIRQDPAAAAMGGTYLASVGRHGFEANPALAPFSSGKGDVSLGWNLWQPSSTNYVNLDGSMCFKQRFSLSLGFSYGIGAAYESISSIESIPEKFNPKDLMIGAGFGMRFGKYLGAGVKLRYIGQTLSPDSKLGTVSADILLSSRIKDFAVTLGAVNLGGKVAVGKNATTKFPIPSSIALGLGWNHCFAECHNLEILADADYYFHNEFSAALGAEYSWNRMVALRAGYHYGKLVPSHASLGAGFSFKGFNLDFSYLISKKDCPVNNSAVLRLGYCF